MVFVDELADDAIFTRPPPFLQRAIASILAPVARRLGYRALYSEYNDDEFWEIRIEQPTV